MHSHRNTSAGAEERGLCGGQKARMKANWGSMHVGGMLVCVFDSMSQVKNSF